MKRAGDFLPVTLTKRQASDTLNHMLTVWVSPGNHFETSINWKSLDSPRVFRGFSWKHPTALQARLAQSPRSCNEEDHLPIKAQMVLGLGFRVRVYGERLRLSSFQRETIV